MYAVTIRKSITNDFVFFPDHFFCMLVSMILIAVVTPTPSLVNFANFSGMAKQEWVSSLIGTLLHMTPHKLKCLTLCKIHFQLEETLQLNTQLFPVLIKVQT